MKLSQMVRWGMVVCLSVSAQESQTAGKMLFLHLLQNDGAITVLDAEIVEGTPRERLTESGPQWEILGINGTVSAKGAMPTPAPLSYDYLDDTGNLSGATLSADSVEFYVRVPYTETADRINFYAPKDSIQNSRATSLPIGSCWIREVLK